MEAHEPQNEYLTRIDEAKQKRMSDVEYLSKSEEGNVVFPYVYEITAGPKRVIGYGTDHSFDAAHPMFADIKARFDESNPDMVFIEGWGSIPSDRDKLREYFAGVTDEQVIQDMGEPGYLLKLAVERGADVISPEPSEVKELEVLAAEGKNRDDIFAYYFYRVVNQYTRLPKGTDFRSYVQKYIDRLKENAKWDDFDFSIEHAEVIGMKLWGTPLNLEDAGYYNERVSPLSADMVGEGYGPVNEVAARVNLLRDETILEKTAEALASHDRVFVSYGGTHMVKLEPSLKFLLEEK